MAIDPKFLITGATGFLGSFLAYRVLLQGGAPILLARAKEGQTGEERVVKALEKIGAALCKRVDPSLAHVLEGDITLPLMGLSRDAYGYAASLVDAVIHSAALLSFNELHAEDLQRCNRSGTLEVVRFCGEAGATLHHVSTAFVCGNTIGDIPEENFGGPPSFRNAYERTKWEAEQIVLDKVRSGDLEALIYRPSIILGDRTGGYTSTFTTLYRWFYALELLARQERRRQKNNGPVNLDLRFPVDPEGVMSIVPVDYVADSLLHVARSEKPDGRIFHLVTRRVPRNRDHLVLVLKALDLEGITLMPCEALPEEEMTSRERKILSAVTDYRSYFDCRIEFLDSGAARALDGSGLEKPLVDQTYIDRIIGYARACRWGRADSKPRPTKEAPRDELHGARAFFSRHLTSFLGKKILPDLKRLDAAFSIILTPFEDAVFFIRIRDARITEIKEMKSPAAAFSFHVPLMVFLEIVAGREDPREAFFTGKTDIQGDLEEALSIIPVLKRFFEEFPYDGPVD